MRNCYLSVNWVIITITTLWLSSKNLVNCACINRSEPLILSESSISSSSSSIVNVKNVVNKVNLKSANITDSRLPPFPQRHRDFNFSDDEEEDDDTVTGYEEYSDQEGSGDSDGSGSSVDSIGSGGINSNFGHPSLDRNKLQIPIDVDSNSLNKDSITGRGNNKSRSSIFPSSSSSSSSSLTFLSSSFLWLIIGINFLLISSSNCFVNFSIGFRL